MYTDGSKNKRGVGAGICYMRDDEVLVEENIGLPAKSNIFQAELRAIQLACDVLSNHPIYGGTSLIEPTPTHLAVYRRKLRFQS